MKYILKIFKHPIGIGVTTAVLSSVVSTPIVAYVKSQSFTDAFVSIFKWVVELLRKTINFGVPLWVILLCAVAYFKIYKPTINALYKSKSLPDLLNYNSDIVDDITWEWGWVYNYGKYNISSQIVAVCTTCNGFLIDGRRSYHINTLECENCGFIKELKEWEHEDYRGKIKREILRRVRNMIKERTI